MVPLALVGLQEAELCRLPWWCLWKSAGLGPGRYSPLFTLLSRCPSRGLLLGKGVSAGSSVLRALGPALSHPTDKGWPFLPPPCWTKPEQLEALGTALAGGGGGWAPPVLTAVSWTTLRHPPGDKHRAVTPSGWPIGGAHGKPSCLPTPSGCPLTQLSSDTSVSPPNHTHH